MNPEHPKAASPAATDQQSGYYPEFTRLYHQMKRTYRALIPDDEIYNKMMTLLESYAKDERDPVSPPRTVNDVKYHMNNLMNIKRLIEDKSYQKTITQTIHALAMIHALTPS